MTVKQTPIRHELADITAKVALVQNRTLCGKYVREVELARTWNELNCPECLKRQAEYELLNV